MTAGEIIQQVERLSVDEKAEVLRVLLRSQQQKGRLSPNELVSLADQMIAADDPLEADRLEKEILAGFYGG